jgi:hypothetical protein
VESTSRNPAPILLIRDAATDAGVSSLQPERTYAISSADVLSTGLVELSTAYSLLEMYVPVVLDIQALAHDSQIPHTLWSLGEISRQCYH